MQSVQAFPRTSRGSPHVAGHFGVTRLRFPSAPFAQDLRGLETPGLLSGILSHVVSPGGAPPVSPAALSLFEADLSAFLRIRSDSLSASARLSHRVRCSFRLSHPAKPSFRCSIATPPGSPRLITQTWLMTCWRLNSRRPGSVRSPAAMRSLRAATATRP